jgi:hypothetical protein
MAWHSATGNSLPHTAPKPRAINSRREYDVAAREPSSPQPTTLLYRGEASSPNPPAPPRMPPQEGTTRCRSPMTSPSRSELQAPTIKCCSVRRQLLCSLLCRLPLPAPLRTTSQSNTAHSPTTTTVATAYSSLDPSCRPAARQL